MGSFKDIAAKLNQDVETALSQDQEDSYIRLSTVLDAMTDALREYFQNETAADVKQLTSKLKGDAPLSSQDIDLLRLWIVGDAESYINTENNVADWKSEFRRAIGEACRYTGDKPSLQDVLKVQALLRDADRSCDDLAFYASQKLRVEKFNSAVQNLTRQDRDLLFGLLNTKRQSKHY